MSALVPPLTDDPLSLAAYRTRRNIGSLWRRGVAFSLDAILVGIPASLMALPFFDALSRVGAWGRLLGFGLALPYFAILNSKSGGGQTLGKRWLRLQVVDKNGKPIPFGRSVIRYSVFAFAFYLNGIALPMTRTPGVISTLISLIIFATGGATLYLVLFNRRTRQGLHDLAVGSFVADADPPGGSLTVQPIWRGHWAIFGSLALALFLGTEILTDKIASMAAFPEIQRDLEVTEDLPNVQSAGVQDLTWRSWGSGETKTIFVVTVHWNGKAGTEESGADDVALAVLENGPAVLKRDLLRIVIIRGYDLGIATAQVTRTYEHSPTEWRERLSKRLPANVLDSE